MQDIKPPFALFKKKPLPTGRDNVDSYYGRGN